MARPLVYFCVFGPQWKKFEHPWFIVYHTRIKVRIIIDFFILMMITGSSTPGMLSITSGATPQTGSRLSGTTPMMRDKLNINPEENLDMKQRTLKEQLKSGLSSLPAPKNDYEIVVPEDEMEDANAATAADRDGQGTYAHIEDQADIDARIETERIKQSNYPKKLPLVCSFSKLSAVPAHHNNSPN